ncbi:hypothetical protein [Dyadobacter sp. CY312]|uniref:hypothetical protein n=1 Tax=Dyadobacter sp. CY312 TaxID=2907303 RepID=UPI001F3F0ACB|nr:hypothetical protein [Dyadobacter sp. CY312]MCE7038777.1 hypothetical protein [Dyadobacter sp. CY312]
MTYIKLIFLFILVLLDRCGIIRRNEGIIPLEKRAARVINVSPDGTWRLTELPEIPSAGNSQDTLPKPQTSQPQTAAIISFFPDSTFTEFDTDGKYVTGNWKYAASDSSITLLKKDGSIKFSTLFGSEANGLRLMTLTDHRNEAMAYAGFGKSLNRYKEDPFYAANNEWRIRPDKSENKQEVLARLRGYLLHSAYLLKAAETRKQQLISWEFSKGIIRIYRSGIGLIDREQIPETWVNSFHSRQEALLAYAILEDFLMTTSYKGDATGNWVIDDYQILMSTYERLKTRNLASVKAI